MLAAQGSAGSGGPHGEQERGGAAPHLLGVADEQPAHAGADAADRRSELRLLRACGWTRRAVTTSLAWQRGSLTVLVVPAAVLAAAALAALIVPAQRSTGLLAAAVTALGWGLCATLAARLERP